MMARLLADLENIRQAIPGTGYLVAGSLRPYPDEVRRNPVNLGDIHNVYQLPHSGNRTVGRTAAAPHGRRVSQND
jgi:hypothetical protein